MQMQYGFYPYAESWCYTEHKAFVDRDREHAIALRLIERGYGPDSKDIAAMAKALMRYQLSPVVHLSAGYDHEWADFSQGYWETYGLPVGRMHGLARELVKLGIVESSPEPSGLEPDSIPETVLYRPDFDRMREFIETPLRSDGWPPDGYHDDSFNRYVLTHRAAQRLLEMGFWLSAFDMAATLARLDKHADEGAIGEWHDLEMEGCYGPEAEDLAELRLLERTEAGKRTIYRLNRKAFREFASASFSREPHDALPRENFA